MCLYYNLVYSKMTTFPSTLRRKINGTQTSDVIYFHPLKGPNVSIKAKDHLFFGGKNFPFDH